jgi:hypothetical protein
MPMSFLPAACQQSMASESLGAYRLGSARFVALGIEATGARMTSGTIRAFISASRCALRQVRQRSCFCRALI